MGCKLRPYEKHHGETYCVINEAMRRLVTTFENDGDKEETLAEAVSSFQVHWLRPRQGDWPVLDQKYLDDIWGQTAPAESCGGARREPDRLRDFARQDSEGSNVASTRV